MPPFRIAETDRSALHRVHRVEPEPFHLAKFTAHSPDRYSWASCPTSWCLFSSIHGRVAWPSLAPIGPLCE